MNRAPAGHDGNVIVAAARRWSRTDEGMLTRGQMTSPPR